MFRFNLGEMVLDKYGIEEVRFQRAHGDKAYPRIIKITSRITEEMPEGVRRWYFGRVPGQSAAYRIEEEDAVSIKDIGPEFLK